MFDRDKQIELIRHAEERTAGYVRNWLRNPEFRAALRSRDCEDGGQHESRPIAASG
jgi:hypothetical protein